MTYKGKRPKVLKITELYQPGTSLPKKAMRGSERCLKREKGLESWFITISPGLNLG